MMKDKIKEKNQPKEVKKTKQITIKNEDQ